MVTTSGVLITFCSWPLTSLVFLFGAQGHSSPLVWKPIGYRSNEAICYNDLYTTSCLSKFILIYSNICKQSLTIGAQPGLARGEDSSPSIMLIWHLKVNNSIQHPKAIFLGFCLYRMFYKYNRKHVHSRLQTKMKATPASRKRNPPTRYTYI